MRCASERNYAARSMQVISSTSKGKYPISEASALMVIHESVLMSVARILTIRRVTSQQRIIDRQPEGEQSGKVFTFASPQFTGRSPAWRYCASRHALVICTVLGLAACTDRAAIRIVHPLELVGTWARRRPDGSFGDTLTFNGDGSVSGSATNPVPASARWSVQVRSKARWMLCASDAKNASCQSYAVTDSTLVLGSENSGGTVYRRVRPSGK